MVNHTTTMICNRCLLRASRASKASIPLPRTFTSTFTRPSQTISPNAATTSAPRTGSPNATHQPPAATSTSAAQPFSAGAAPPMDAKPAAKKSTPPALVLSSVPAGTPLKGLNFMKGKQDPVAMKDEEYPSWLWGLVKEGDEGRGTDPAANLYCTYISNS
ncbi:hypothetical protein LTS18_001914 [Coniosporium uncinatum]|uniref:Uncharacterized protein n=1 Tax=Coniosporium uncinatum TaxID=93489 RepID=A0ACC3CSD1_9PEZI|nr:hypothetical protein LTS18_001914 [Coniosporium uncinatum]